MPPAPPAIDATKRLGPDDYGPRYGAAIDCIVIHTTEGGSIEGALSHWALQTVHASAHYIIDGKQVVQCVPEDLAAFHAGNPAFNHRSIGIEVVGHCDDKRMWTPAILAQLAGLVANIASRRGIPIDHGHIFGHADVPDPHDPTKFGGASHHTDPGIYFNFQSFLAAVALGAG
jgi:N-acetyl-anhydromuramyl-L-alanine amidase AmpD